MPVRRNALPSVFAVNSPGRHTVAMVAVPFETAPLLLVTADRSFTGCRSGRHLIVDLARSNINRGARCLPAESSTSRSVPPPRRWGAVS